MVPPTPDLRPLGNGPSQTTNQEIQSRESLSKEPQMESAQGAPHQLQKLIPRHFKILDLYLEGMSQVDIAKEVGMHQANIGLVVRSPVFQNELALRRSLREKDEKELRQTGLVQAKGVLEGAAFRAAETQVGLLESEDDRIKLASSNSILDRVFGDEKGPVGVVINTETVQLLSLAVQESRSRE